jgi:hypothetical protein
MTIKEQIEQTRKAMEDWQDKLQDCIRNRSVGDEFGTLSFGLLSSQIQLLSLRLEQLETQVNESKEMWKEHFEGKKP